MAARKKFTFRGYNVEDLKDLSMDEIVSLLTARQRRSLTREMDKSHIRLYERIQKIASGSKKTTKPIRTHLRDFVILPNMVGMEMNIYNGREYLKVVIMPEMIGHYLGEYAPTTKVVKHSAPGIGATRSSMFVPLK